MRRLIAALSLLALANLMFVQGGSACPLAGSAHHEQAAAQAVAGHGGHDMSSMENHNTAQSVPEDGSSHAPACLTMGPCAMTLDLARSGVAASTAAQVDRLLAISDHLPRSAGITPELPPPRA